MDGSRIPSSLGRREDMSELLETTPKVEVSNLQQGHPVDILLLGFYLHEMTAWNHSNCQKNEPTCFLSGRTKSLSLTSPIMNAWKQLLTHLNPGLPRPGSLARRLGHPPWQQRWPMNPNFVWDRYLASHNQLGHWNMTQTCSWNILNLREIHFPTCTCWKTC